MSNKGIVRGLWGVVNENKLAFEYTVQNFLEKVLTPEVLTRKSET